MRARLSVLFAVVMMLLTVAGCQPSTTFAPPPDFRSPTIRPGIVQPPKPAVAVIPGPARGIGQGFGPMVSGGTLKPKAPTRAWKYIIVHHSDTPVGCAARFDSAHRARGWEMLGYDFVIGNGTESRDGLIEVGPRWTHQLIGAHTGTPDHTFNEYGIGICLVGNFDLTRPTRAQMDSLARLTAYFMKTYGIPANHVLGHRDCKPTGCPGRYMDINQVRKLAQAFLLSGSY